jgi:PST family polysaccharide transporter
VHDTKWLALAPSFIRRRLSGRHLLQTLASNTGWLVADKLVRLGFGLLVGVWIARYLGPANFGLLNFAIAFVALFATVSGLGLQGVMVRDLVIAPQRREVLLASALLLRVAAAATMTILAIIAVEFLRPRDQESIRIVSVVALMMLPQAWDVIDFDYQARVQARPIVIIRGISFLLSSMVKLSLILSHASVLAFAWITTGEMMLAALLMSLYARTHGTLPRARHATRAELWYLLRVTWPLIISSLSVVLYWRIDQVMLAQMIGDAEVGLFSAAVRVSEVWYFIPIAITSSAAPALTAIFARSRAEYLDKLAMINRLLVMFAIAVAILFTVFAKPIVLALYGIRYGGSAAILAIHSWAGIFVALGVGSSAWFVNTGNLNFQMYRSLAGAVCNIALNFFLIPRYAGIGAAIATVISQIVSTVALNPLSAETRELFAIQARSLIPWTRKRADRDPDKDC